MSSQRGGDDSRGASTRPGRPEVEGSRTAGRGRAVAAAGAVLLALAACGAPAPNAPDVPTGAWSGDVDFPGQPDVAWGATWHVARADTAAGLRLSLNTPGSGGRPVGPVALEVEGDTLRFPLPFRRSASCTATREEDGSWRGSCGSTAGTTEVVLVPPDRTIPVGAARMALERVDGDWRRTRSGRVVAFTRPGTEAHRHRDAVVEQARGAVARAVELTGEDGWEGPVRLVYLESPKEMERAVGRAVRGGWADAGGDAALLVTYEGGATGVLHEVIHVVSIGQWGTAASPPMWLQEGLAEWGAGGDCGAVSHGRLDRYLHRRGDGLPVSALAGEFRQHDDRITMPQVTTLVGYLLDAHGLEAVRGLWERGIGEVGAVLGYGTDELERRWRTWVEERYRPATEEEWSASIGSEAGCPREAPGPAGGSTAGGRDR